MEKHVAQSFDLFPIFSCILYQLSTNFARLVCTFDLFTIIMIQVCVTQCLRDDEEDLRILTSLYLQLTVMECTQLEALVYQ